MTALSTNLVVAKDLYPDRIALRCDDLTFTFAEFHAAARGWRRCWSGPASSPATGWD